jgi:hypothetical protein
MKAMTNPFDMARRLASCTDDGHAARGRRFQVKLGQSHDCEGLEIFPTDGGNKQDHGMLIQSMS